ncbi:hypothetical protein AX15_001322 [Amanita polypyramis BW_CC]|nr:hypothetical protein AX15_001322 [Amanita polypyramis BW_CC]
MTSSSRRDRRVILIGVGGPTCSGKTTLAKHLQNILPNSVIVHQDDFWPDEVPIHPKYNVQDWDSASGAIAWPRFVDFLRQIKLTGVIPSDHHSHDHLNEQKDIPISDECRQKWISEFNTSREGITWIIVDGFLLYWHPVSQAFDNVIDNFRHGKKGSGETARHTDLSESAARRPEAATA